MKTARNIGAILMVVNALVVEASAQLAITEVMAAPSNINYPDYWELTNFGTNDLNLTGYGFHDSNPGNLATNMFTNLVIRARESIIFVRMENDSVIQSETDFEDWWGENLPQGLQVRFWLNGGLDGDNGESIWVLNSNRMAVATVAFDKSERGRSFTYSPETGEFGIPSVLDATGHVFRAAKTTNDIGSPGRTTGPSLLSIRVPPATQTQDVCSRAVFSVVAPAMPPPRYQWTHEGTPIPSATAASYVIPRVDLADAGEYRVILNNGLTNVVSEPAILTVSTNRKPPQIVRPPQDIIIFPGQTAVFEVEAQGYPCPQFQWHSNGVVIAGATNSAMSVDGPEYDSESFHHYSVTVWNELGSINTSATLSVRRRPRLVITEIMSSPTNGLVLRHLNWFELTNYDTNSVLLQGYRFRDSTNLSVASTITNAVSIGPGESIIFVEAMSADEFKTWWGPPNLPSHLQIITWGGWGLSARGGTDTINIWNRAPTYYGDTVASETRSNAKPGISQLSLKYFCDSADGCISTFNDDSIEGERGAFRAAIGGDIGSPGYATFPRVLGILRVGPSIRIRCLVEEGKEYRLMASEDLSGSSWATVTTVTAHPFGYTWTTITFETPATDAPTQFYRLEELQSP